MNKNRKTSHILNVFQYDETTGAVTLPSTLVLTAPASNDNSTKVGTTAWVRTYVTGLSYLTGNQSITVSGDATGSGTTSIALTLANTAVTPGTYGSTTLVPVVTVDSKGRITSVTTAAISGSLTFTGDVTGTGTTGTSTGLTLAASGVTVGTYTKVTVDSKGRVTVGASSTTSDISEGTNLYYTDARVLAYLGANNYATQSYVGTQVANLVAAAPATLDTLNELAAALGNDPSFATTTATSLGNRLRVDTAAQGLNSTQQGNGRTNLGLGSAALSASGDFATAAQGTKADTAHGWGNHASGGYLTSATAATTYASLTGAYANPAFVASLAYSKITGVPAFLTSYTETDPYRVTTVAVSGTSTKTITLTRADASTVTTTWTDYDTDTNTYVTSAGFSGGTLTLTRNDAGTVTVSLDGRYYLATNPSGYLTGITSGQVTGALGFTPYNATNPAGYITGVTNISGNAGTVTNATFYRQFTVRDDRSDGSDYSLAARATGLYAINSAGTNGPGHGYLSLIHVANGGDVAFQIAGGYNSDAMYFRGTTALQNGTGYSTWRTVVHSGNIGSYAVTSLTDTLATVTARGASTSTSLTATEIYNNGWFRNNNVNQGLYNQSSGNHFYSGTASRWNITGASNNTVKLLFRNTHESTIFGSVYADSNPAIGFLSADENWALRVDASKNVQIYGTDLTVGNSTSSNIYMTDTDETTRRIHCNTGRIGFLNSSNGWGAYCDNSGNWFANNLSGTNTGDQTNISGNAATATTAPSGTNRGDQIHGSAGVTPATSFGSMPSAMSGFTDNWGGGDLPSGMSHVHGIACRHFNNSSNNWGWHMVGQYDQPGDLRVRWVNAGTWTGYYQLVTTSNIGSQKADGSLKLWAASHPNDYYIVNNWTGSHWRLTSNHGSPVRVGYSDDTGAINSAVGNAYYWSGIQYFETNNGGSAVNNSNTAKLEAYSSSNNTAFMSFHRGGYYAINMGLDNDNVFRIGGWSASGNRFQMDMSGNLTMAGDVTAYSDARVKENIATIENALNKVLALRGVSYNRIDSDDKKTKIGVIAQETLPIVPEVVNQDNDGMYNVSYGNLAGLFIEAIKEQQKEIEELKTLIYGITR